MIILIQLLVDIKANDPPMGVFSVVIITIIALDVVDAMVGCSVFDDH